MHRCTWPGVSWLFCVAICIVGLSTCGAADQQPLKESQWTPYSAGAAIPISCLNRTIDTGEHITDAHGQLQYVPFPTCQETGRPLELRFGVEQDINCTIDFISDTLFHLLEFYVHNDAPLTCRVPSRPLSSTAFTARDAPSDGQYAVSDSSAQIGALGSQSTLYTPLAVALAGTLQLSHLHISSQLNVLLHTGSGDGGGGEVGDGGAIEAATAYSISAHKRQTRVAIGDSLVLQFSVRWYPSTSLPSGLRSGGSDVFTVFLCCALSAAASAVLCIAYFHGFELPRRVQKYTGDRIMPRGGGGDVKRARHGYELPTSSPRGSYGYGLGKTD